MGRDLKTVHTSIKSNKKGKEEAIVSQVGYDKNGRTIYTRMFNGTENTNGCRACCHSQRRQHYANAILIRPRRQYFRHFQRYYTKGTEETERARRVWPYGWHGRPRCRQGKEGKPAGRCVQSHVRLRRT